MYDIYFDTGFSPCGVSGFDSFNPGLSTPMMDFSMPAPMTSFPTPNFDMGLNGGFDMGMPITCGYSPAPFGCNPVSMDLSGNVCIDGIPITPSTPPAWMTANAMQAEMHMQQLDAELNDPNLWMKFLPPMPPMPTPNWENVDWFEPTIGPMDMNNIDWMDPMADDPFSQACCGSDLFNQDMMNDNPFSMVDLNDSQSHSSLGDDVLPCGLTQSAYDHIHSRMEDNINSIKSLIDSLKPGECMAARAMLQNTHHTAERNLRDLDKPYGRF